MKKTILIYLLLVSTAYATDVSIPTTYQTNGSVTASNLNSNFNALSQKINGGLDNDNADTTNGYRFFETKSTLPTVGTQGRTIFLTTDNTLNLDTGSAYVKSVVVSGTPAQGDVIYYNGSAWTKLAAGTSGQVLQTNGVSANPSWATVIPSGIIMLWSGTIATIPTGWVLCNGSNSTPDLRNLFVVGANADSGGAAKSTITGAAAQTGGATTSVSNAGNNSNTTVQSGSGTSVAGTSHTHTSTIIPPFYALAYIMKS